MKSELILLCTYYFVERITLYYGCGCQMFTSLPEPEVLHDPSHHAGFNGVTLSPTLGLCVARRTNSSHNNKTQSFKIDSNKSHLCFTGALRSMVVSVSQNMKTSLKKSRYVAVFQSARFEFRKLIGPGLVLRRVIKGSGHYW